MRNLRVAVNNAADQTEARNIMISLGYLPKEITCISGGDLGFVVNAYNENGATYKEMTLTGLRDLVVLKRNDRKDANVSEENCLYDLYLTESGELYFYHCSKNKWILSNLNGDDFYYELLKPIEKPMKEPKQAEFLVKTDNSYVLQVLDKNAGGADVVRIPDGAEIAVKSSRGYIEFRKGKSFYVEGCEEWCKGSWHAKDFPKHGWDIVWKRETLNDQVASAEEYREMISNASILGRSSVVVDIAQSCSGGAIRNSSSQGQSDFPLNNYELNHRVAKAFNAVRGTYLNEDDVNYIRELIDLTVSHYGERK